MIIINAYRCDKCYLFIRRIEHVCNVFVTVFSGVGPADMSKANRLYSPYISLRQSCKTRTCCIGPTRVEIRPCYGSGQKSCVQCLYSDTVCPQFTHHQDWPKYLTNGRRVQ